MGRRARCACDELYAWLAYVVYMSVTRQLHGGYVSVAVVMSVYMAVTWRLHGSLQGGYMAAYIAATWRLHGGYMAATWRLHGGYMAVTWRLHGACLLAVAIPPGILLCSQSSSCNLPLSGASW